MDTYRKRVILFSALIRVSCLETGYQNQAKSSLEQGQVSGGPAAHPHQNFSSVPPIPPPPPGMIPAIGSDHLETTILANKPWDTIEYKLNCNISATCLQRLPLSPHSMLFLYCSYSDLQKTIFLTLRIGEGDQEIILKTSTCSSVPR